LGKLEELPERPAFNIQTDEGNVLVSIQGEFVFEYTVIVAEDGEYSLKGRGFEIPAVCRRRETFGEVLPDLLHAACQHAAVAQMELLRDLHHGDTDDKTRETPRPTSGGGSPGSVSADDATISFDLTSTHPGRRLPGRARVRQLIGTMELGCRTGRGGRPILEGNDDKNAIEAETIFSAEVEYEPAVGGEAGKRLVKEYGLNLLHPKLTLGYDAPGERAVVFAGDYAPAWRSMRSRPDETRLADFADLIREMLQCYLHMGEPAGPSS
jgi:hypothetical protein